MHLLSRDKSLDKMATSSSQSSHNDTNSSQGHQPFLSQGSELHSLAFPPVQSAPCIPSSGALYPPNSTGMSYPPTTTVMNPAYPPHNTTGGSATGYPPMVGDPSIDRSTQPWKRRKYIYIL